MKRIRVLSIVFFSLFLIAGKAYCLSMVDLNFGVHPFVEWADGRFHTTSTTEQFSFLAGDSFGSAANDTLAQSTYASTGIYYTIGSEHHATTDGITNLIAYTLSEYTYRIDFIAEQYRPQLAAGMAAGREIVFPTGELFDIDPLATGIISFESNIILANTTTNQTETASRHMNLFFDQGTWSIDTDMWYGGDPASGSFHAISRYGLAMDFLDGNAGYFSFDYSLSVNLRESINDPPSAVPEPATMFLLGIGLFGIGGIYRKTRSKL